MTHRDSFLSYFARYRASENPRERAKRAGRPERRSAARRRSRRHAPGVQYSDEALSALTRGLHMPASQDRDPTERMQAAPDGTFEETYPRYPFAPLVRMAIAVADFVNRRLRR